MAGRALLVATAALLLSGTASAQVAWGPPPGSFPVVLHASDPNVSFTLAHEKDSPPFVACQGECVLPLFAGDYFLKIDETKSIIGGKRRFKVDAPSDVSIEPRTYDDRAMGQLMGGIGIGLLVLGTVGMVATGIHIDGERENDNGEAALFAVSFFGFVGGAVLTPIGWVKAGRAAPVLSVTPLAPAPR
ncbi:MAG: hypothetical protein HS104_03420 [Polyangiaceae bacterium]|nr:hypothetical protein [Polyangiaceae bacterium]MCL4750558.1 hypothetical protein [Myxococcales bacterium]